MRRFLVFAGDTFYPKGGMNDLILQTDDFESAEEIAMTSETSYAFWWWHIYDTELNRILVEKWKD